MRQRPVASRSRTDIVRARSLFVRSVATRSQLSCSSASCPSSASSARSPRTSRPICAFRARPWLPSRRLARHTWSVCSRTPTCAPSMPSASPLCPRTSSWLVAFVASALKCSMQSYIIQSTQTPTPGLFQGHHVIFKSKIVSFIFDNSYFVHFLHLIFSQICECFFVSLIYRVAENMSC